jgi:hypothetical protein
VEKSRAWVGGRDVLVLTPWGAKERQTLATGTGLVMAREGVVIDRYVGRIVHGSVPGCRSHPRSTELFDGAGVWGAAGGELDWARNTRTAVPPHRYDALHVTLLLPCSVGLPTAVYRQPPDNRRAFGRLCSEP